LAKIVRSVVAPALENIKTWHERDLTQSSTERFVIPQACILVDYMLSLMSSILAGLKVDEQHMRKNMELTQGRMMSEPVMMALVKKGMNRQKAHELLRKLTIKSEAENCLFRNVLFENEVIHSFLNEKEIDVALNPHNYLGTAVQQVENVIQGTSAERKARGIT
jgi:adenylosuccinate lyase